jgi:Uma2 family endonuclease
MSKMAVQRELGTAETLLQLPDDGNRHELVRGEIRTMPPAIRRHGLIAMEFSGRLFAYVKAHALGRVYAAETGFRLRRDPDTVRAPGAAFISATRNLPEPSLTGYEDIVPDLVAEVVSPHDSAASVEEKVQEWLQAGVRMVLVLHPTTRSVTRFRSLTDIQVLTSADELDLGDVVPGFHCPVAEIFA